jgi:hypothetical protein
VRNPAHLAQDSVSLCLMRNALATASGVSPSSVLLVAVLTTTSRIPISTFAAGHGGNCCLAAAASSGIMRGAHRLQADSDSASQRDLQGSTASSAQSFLRADVMASINVSQSALLLVGQNSSSDPAAVVTDAVRAALSSPATLSALFGPVLNASCVAQGVEAAACPNATSLTLAVKIDSPLPPSTNTDGGGLAGGGSSGSAVIIAGVVGSLALVSGVGARIVFYVRAKARRGGMTGEKAPSPADAAVSEPSASSQASAPSAPVNVLSDASTVPRIRETAAVVEGGAVVVGGRHSGGVAGVGSGGGWGSGRELFELMNPIHSRVRGPAEREAFGPVRRGART